MSMIDGSRYHQTGNPTKIVSYFERSGIFLAIFGRHVRLFISVVVRLNLLVQSKSSAVYFSAGTISNRSASIAAAKSSARPRVVSVALKYATSVFFFMGFSFLSFLYELYSACGPKSKRIKIGDVRQLNSGPKETAGLANYQVKTISIHHIFPVP